MKRTVTVNLNRRVFTIDEDAYELLDSYLKNLQVCFRKEEDASEILSDFEARIEELLSQKLLNGVQVINKQDIEEVISLMGSPADFGTENFSEEETQRIYEEPAESKKRFYRDLDTKMVGGVCSGIAAYFGTEPLPVRIVFIILFVFTKGLFAFVYLGLWMFIPSAKTAEEKLQMRGEPVTVENIGKVVSSQTEEVKKKGKGFLNGVVEFFATIFKIFLVGIGSIVGISLLFAVVVTIIVFFAVVLGVGDNIFTNVFYADHWGMPSPVFPIILFLIFLIPLFGIIYSLVAHFSKLKPMNKWFKWGLVLTWIAILLLLLFSVFKVNVVRGNGISSNNIYSFSNINSVELGGSMPSEVFIQQIEGEETNLSIHGDTNLLELINVRSTETGHLIISTKGDQWIGYKDKIQIYLKTPTLNKVNTQGAKNVEFKGKFVADKLNIAIQGIGNVETDSLYVKELSLRTDGTGNFNVLGKAGRAYLEVNGAGNIDAEKLDADSVYASINGVGNIDCNPLLYIDANINGAGSITYKEDSITEKRSSVAGLGVLNTEKSF